MRSERSSFALSHANLDRRELLAGAAGLGVAALAGCANAAEIQAYGVSGGTRPLAFKDNVWTRDTFAMTQGNLDFEQKKIGWYKGTVLGIRPGERVTELFGFEGFSCARLQQREDGSWQKLLREVGFYRDLKTQEIMDTWHNPYTDETVPVVSIANDPFNFVIGEYFPEPPSYGGLNKEKPPKIPFLLNWTQVGDKWVNLEIDIHLLYPNSMTVEEWPRESAGNMVQVSEMFRYSFLKTDLEDGSRTTLDFRGTWNRVTPWLPWMLMGQATGHCLYVCHFGAADDFDELPQDIVRAAEAIDPKYLDAPRENYGPSLSSLEHYRREQKPASVKE